MMMGMLMVMTMMGTLAMICGHRGGGGLRQSGRYVASRRRMLNDDGKRNRY